MTIKYGNADAFYVGVYQLVSKGLTFRATYDTLTIELLGGF